MRAYGNWCGPGWTAGQYKGTAELTDADRDVPAIDELDEACKQHDIQLHDHPELANEINEQFISTVQGMGIRGALFALAVGIAGPAPAPAHSATSNMVNKRLRFGDVRDTIRESQEDPELDQSRILPRRTPTLRAEDLPTSDPELTAALDRLGAGDASPSDGGPMSPTELMPDINGDITSQSTRDYTVRRDRARLDSRQAMDVTMADAPAPTLAASALRSGSGSTSNTVAKETPITPALPSYGLPETHTTILPWSGWISAGGLTKSTPLQLKIRMNSPWDMLDMTTGTTSNGNYPSGKAFYACQMSPDGKMITNSTVNFPESFTSNSTEATERPAWREYFAKLYDQYTVLGCEYEIIVYNPLQLKCPRLGLVPGPNGAAVANNTMTITYPDGTYNTDCVCAVQFDTFTSTENSVGNVMPQTNYSEVRAYKNIQWYGLPGGQKKVIRGTYKPGQAKRNIVNDGDVKTWTQTTVGIPPTLKEYLTLNFWTDPFFNARLVDDIDTSGVITLGGDVYGVLNMEINLKYIVQFKDLKQQARYPNTVTTDQDITQILNEDKTAKGSALQSWTTPSTAG